VGLKPGAMTEREIIEFCRGQLAKSPAAIGA
jgi:hypothetical protein